MRLLAFGLAGFVLLADAQAQWYQTPASSNVTVVVQQPSPPPVVVVREREPRRTAYLIAFKDSRVSLADTYWVNGLTLYYVTPDRLQKTALLDTVDRDVSWRLNAEQNMAFELPPVASQSSVAKASGKGFASRSRTAKTSHRSSRRCCRCTL